MLSSNNLPEEIHSEDFAPRDDEGSPVMDRYKKLKGMELCFGKIAVKDRKALSTKGNNMPIPSSFTAALRLKL